MATTNSNTNQCGTDGIPPEVLRVVRELLDKERICSVSCSMGDIELWSMLIAEQLFRAHQNRIELQDALALSGPGWDMPKSRITIGTGRVHLRDRGLCLAEFLILHRSFGVRAMRSATAGTSRLPALDRCRFLLIKRDFGEVENASRRAIGYWTLYRSLQVMQPADRFAPLSGSETTNQVDAAPSGLPVQSAHEEERAALDNLIRDSRMYDTTTAYEELIEFVARLRHIAPYNAMLLHTQRPGSTYAATREDWMMRFGRYPKPGARPLIILKPYRPVDFVYELQDTDGRAVPMDAFSYTAAGDMSDWQISRFRNLMSAKGIESFFVDAGDGSAGSIKILRQTEIAGDNVLYQMEVNRNHDQAIQFVTIAHELAHLFLGHLGSNEQLSIRSRRENSHAKNEVEAESVAFLVCRRHGIKVRSETYLQHFAEVVDEIEIYVIMKAVGAIEKLLKLNEFDQQQDPAQGRLDL